MKIGTLFTHTNRDRRFWTKFIFISLFKSSLTRDMTKITHTQSGYREGEGSRTGSPVRSCGYGTEFSRGPSVSMPCRTGNSPVPGTTRIATVRSVPCGFISACSMVQGRLRLDATMHMKSEQTGRGSCGNMPVRHHAVPLHTRRYGGNHGA